MTLQEPTNPPPTPLTSHQQQVPCPLADDCLCHQGEGHERDRTTPDTLPVASSDGPEELCPALGHLDHLIFVTSPAPAPLNQQQLQEQK